MTYFILKYSKTSLNRPTMGRTLSGPFKEAVGLGVRILLQGMGNHLGPKKAIGVGE